jgi:hypothetical protein
MADTVPPDPSKPKQHNKEIEIQLDQPVIDHASHKHRQKAELTIS